MVLVAAPVTLVAEVFFISVPLVSDVVSVLV
jgi:hypothetical protein